MNAKTLAAFALAPTLLALPACDLGDSATREEMREAVIEIAELGDGLGTQDDIIELTTSFTLGQGVEAAAQEIRDFVESQVPCSTVTVQPGRVSIDFGELGDACVYRGRTYAGVVTVDLELPGEGAKVTHTYEGFTGGRVTMDGTATVTWNDGERHIIGDWTFTTDDRTTEVDSDRTQTFTRCEGVEAVCVSVTGERRWSNDRGEWDMTIDGVEARSIDPVPEAGTYTVVNPEGREIGMSFSRVDDDTIQVDITGGRRDVSFQVTAAGQVS
ncbi:hypothetical protein [Paraliomyxa miuraensis]|uniref:hypothetical protein n=1 Tax=Paraliomyxa miuraensis TaxID=376150 RepID=UPI002256EF83|nr:hypothetical protein [Paraliomyxa miuraensis]MCX4247022.1 hypothetical protein [Paraliomyxa miuraensis]